MAGRQGGVEQQRKGEKSGERGGFYRKGKNYQRKGASLSQARPRKGWVDDVGGKVE